MKPEWKVGDVVRLKSGGPAMTIICLTAAHEVFEAVTLRFAPRPAPPRAEEPKA